MKNHRARAYFWGSGTLKIVTPVENHPPPQSRKIGWRLSPPLGVGVLISGYIGVLTMYVHIGAVNSGRHDIAQKPTYTETVPAAGHACSLRGEQSARRGRNPHLVQRRYMAGGRETRGSATLAGSLQSKDSSGYPKSIFSDTCSPSSASGLHATCGWSIQTLEPT